MKDRKRIVRKRNILYLIENFLADNMYRDTARCLRNEAKLNKEYVVCDNINLENIVVEFETYYQQRFQKNPQLCKRIETETKFFPDKTPNKALEMKDISCNKTVSSDSPNDLELIVCSTSLMNTKEKQFQTMSQQRDKTNDCNEFAEIIRDCIEVTNIGWNDVKGLEDVKEILKEAIIYPIKYPYLFTGIIQPWKSILLYGPPGTGKTSLAKAMATESSATFFHISVSTIVTKWRGDGEKIIKVLFETAHKNAPCIIFIDEIDALAIRRNAHEHEASRRLKSQIFTEMDALSGSKEHVFFLAATNTPWDLDEAMLRRFEKHIFVPMPDLKTRKLIIRHYLPETINKIPSIECEVNYEYAAKATEHLSSSDIKHLCKNIIMSTLREILLIMETKQNPKSMKKLIRTEDFDNTVATFQPSVRYLVDKYVKWQSEHIA